MPIDFQPEKSTVNFTPVDFQPEEAPAKAEAPALAPASIGAVPEVRNGEVIRPAKPVDRRSMAQKAKDYFIGNQEAGLNALTGAAAFPIGLVAGVAKGDLEEGAKVAGKLTYQPKTDEGQDLSHTAGDIVNRYLIPMTGIHGIVPKVKEAPKRPIPVEDILKNDVKKPVEFTPDEAFWKDRAEKMTAEARAKEAPPPVLRAQMRRPNLEQENPTAGTPQQMEGLSRSTEGVTYENIPPDAVIPRDAPTKGVEVPRIGEWTKDENGMPVRVGFAPEHALEPYRGEPINEAARNDLGVAINYEANGPKLGADDHWGSEPLNPPSKVINTTPGGRQGGRINTAIWEPGFDAIKRISDNIVLRVRGPDKAARRPDPMIYAIDTSNPERPQVVGHVSVGRDNYMAPADAAKDNIEAMYTNVDESHRGQGIAEAMYRYANELGNDIVPSKVQTDLGKKMWAGFEKRGYTGKASDMSRGMGGSQRGGVDFGAIGEALQKVRERFSQSKPMTPEEVAARDTQRTKAQVLTNALGTKIPEWLDPKSAEETAAMAVNAKDIKSNPYFNALAPGNNFMATYHNNPLLKYARRLFNQAREERVTFENQFMTGKEGTITQANKLTSSDKLRLNELLSYLEKNGRDYSDDIGDRVGLSQEAKDFANSWNKAKDAAWEWSQKVHGDQGVTQAPHVNGYLPGMSEGSYHAAVMVGDKLVAMIHAETPGDFYKAKKYYEGKYEEAKFSADSPAKARVAIQGGEAAKWKFRDLSSIIGLLTSEDNSFSALQQKLNQAALKDASGYKGFDVHNLAKANGEGRIEGTMGDRGWLSPERNAQDRISSMNHYLTQAADYHSMQHPIEELNTLMAQPEFAHMPNARAYLDRYMQQAKGDYTHGGGTISNVIFDTASKLPEAMPGLNKVWGPRTAMKITNGAKNVLSQMYMSWFNIPFMIGQLLQPVQTGVPFGFMVAERMGLTPTDFAASMSKGYMDFIKYDTNQMTGAFKDMHPEIKAAGDWAKNRGIMDFSEAEKVFSGDHGKVVRGINKVGDYSMKQGEHMSRSPMFFTFYDLARKGGADESTAREVAEHWTNHAMGDYAHNERPAVYAGMGAMAPQTGALTTFKHSYVGMQAILAKEMKSNPKPVVASALTAVALAGLTGLAGYQEVDAIYQALRGWSTGEKRSIRQDMMGNLPEGIKTGLISQAVGLNMQSKFETSNLAGGRLDAADLGKTLAPYASGMYDVAHDVGKAVIDPSKTNLANAAVTLAPTTLRQAAKSAFQREDNWLLDRKGQHDVERTPEDWKKAVFTGLVPMGEKVQKENLYQNRQNEKFRMDKLKEASTMFKEAMIDDDVKKQEEALNAYEAAGGNPGELLRQTGHIMLEQQMSGQERAEGRPRGVGGVSRYENYQTK